MKFILSLVLISVVNADFDCKEVPKTPLDFHCCKTPDLIDASVMNYCETQSEDEQYTEILKECLIVNCICTKLDLFVGKKISRERLMSHMVKNVTQNPKWGPLITSNVDSCIKSIDKQEIGIRKIFSMDPFNIDPQECDVLPMLMAYCVDAVLLTNCPNDAWNEDENCKEWREYLNHCNVFTQIAAIDTSELLEVF